ncbi:MAG: fasciclin domain-containing protein [Phycisphaerae bacterium]|nr:fasciclin domain-containing protein [Phycisphaerae bacterium]
MLKHSLVRRWLPVATIVVLAGWTGLSLAQDKKPTPAEPKAKNVVDVAKDTHSLKTFCKLVDAAGLAETLKGKGPYTVFAPTEEAFKTMGKEVDNLLKPENKAKLERLLKNHIVEGQKTAADVKAMKSVKTLAGCELEITVEEEAVMVGAAKVTKADMSASNGVIHLVDAVLTPVEKVEVEP